MTLDDIGRAALGAASYGAAGLVDLAAELARELGVRRDYAVRLLEDYVGYAGEPQGQGVPLSEYVWLVGVHCVKGD